MALEMLIGVSMIVFTLTVHAAALTGLLVLIHQSGRRPGGRTIFARAARVLLALNAVFLLHLLEVIAYALLFLAVGAVHSFRDGLMFSAGQYATLGSDISVRRDWRMLAAMEGANGVILLGFSTAFYVSVLARIRELLDEWTRRGETA